MRVGVLYSGGGSAIPFLEKVPDLEIVAGATSHIGNGGSAKLKSRGVPVFKRSIHKFYKKRGVNDIKDMQVREEWDKSIIDFMKKHNPDVLACSGYMYILTREILDKYTILNVHPADLRIQDEEGNRKYFGENAVSDALRAGEKETRSTIHVMNNETDGGPILVISPPVPVNSDLMGLVKDEVKEAANIHQEYMKHFADGPAYAMALDLMAKGKIKVAENGDVYYQFKGPLKAGLVMDETFQPYGLEIADPIIRKADEL